MCKVITPESRIEKMEEHLTYCEKYQKRYETAVTDEKKLSIQIKFTERLDAMKILITQDFGDSEKIKESVNKFDELFDSLDVKETYGFKEIWSAIDNLKTAILYDNEE